MARIPTPYRPIFAFILSLTVIVCWPVLCYAQQISSSQNDIIQGYPFSISYERVENYRGAQQTWGALKGHEGLLYFGNTTYGIQQTDGTNWTTIAMPNSDAAISIAESANNTIYVGGRTSFGFLERDSLNMHTYVSLSSPVADSLRPVTEVFTTIAADTLIYFVSKDYVALHQEGTTLVRYLDPDSIFTDAVSANGQIWINDLKSGPGVIHQNNTIKYPETPFKAGNHLLFEVNGKPAIITNKKDVWLFEGGLWRQLLSLSIFDQNPNLSLYDVTALKDGNIAVATNEGVYTNSTAGNIVHHLTTETGLSSNFTHQLYTDKNGTLWVTSNYGISGFEYGRPMRKFHPTQGLTGSYRTISEYNNVVLTGTQTGLLISNDGSFTTKLSGTVIYDLRETEKGILIGTNDGLYLFDGTAEIKQLLPGISVNKILPDKHDPTVFYSSSNRNGLVRVKTDFEEQTEYDVLFPFYDTIFTVHQDKYDDLWLGTGRNGIIYLKTEKVNGTSESVLNHKVFTKEDGLPSNGFNYTKTLRDDVGFITSNGFYRLHAARDSIIEDTRYADVFSTNERAVWPVVPDRDGNNWLAWAAVTIGKTVYNPDSDHFEWEEGEYTRIAPFLDINHIHHGESGRIYFLASSDIAYYDSLIPHDPLPPFRTHITNISVNKDSLVYTGRGLSENKEKLRLSYTENSLRFNWGLISYLPADRNYYQFRLIGLDDDWSGWTNELYRDYNNLQEGEYVFEVRGRNLYNTISEPSKFTFVVTPPWYRSWFAWIVYGIGAFLLIGGTLKWRTRKLVQRQQVLEKEVINRTAEIDEKNKQLEKLNSVKTRFFTNISHEFRTPLTLIKGPAQLLKDRKSEISTIELSQTADGIISNANRLLTMVEEVLNLSKMESGSFQLEIQQLCFADILHRVCSWYRPLAEQKNLFFKVIIEEAAVGKKVFLDERQMELFISNLLSNAVKYTTHGGVTITLGLQENQLHFSVEDTGTGISEEDIPNIFEPYYRSKSVMLSRSGSGIGLNLVRFIANLQGIELVISSKMGEGTHITAKIPGTKEALKGEYVILEDDSTVFTHNSSEYQIPASGLQAYSDPIMPLPQNDNEDIPIILIVDDNKDIREFIRSVLSNSFRYVECSNGLDGFKQAKLVQPDLILSDVMMPGLDGYLFAKKIKENQETAHIPLILITAKGGEHNELTGLEAGANDYIAKPFSPSILKARVQGQLALQYQLRQYLTDQLSQKEMPDPEHSSNPEESEPLSDFMNLIHKHIQSNLTNPDFSVEVLAMSLNMSTSSLYRKLKKHSTLSAQDIIKNERLELAKKLLEERKGNVTETAYAVGYNSISYFSRAFKDQFGNTASEVYHQNT